MVRLISINYRNKKYPDGIVPKIEEIPAHFDSKITTSNLDYSLHTEYSYSPRKFICSACRNLLGIKAADGKGVPKLWFNDTWVKDFIRFILRFIEDRPPLELLKSIHLLMITVKIYINS